MRRYFFLSLYFLLFPLLITAQEAFIVMKGSDTLSVERFLRERDLLEGRLLVKQQQIPITYEASLGSENSLDKLTMAAHEAGAAADARPLQEGTMIFKKDSIYTTTTRGSAVQKDSFQTKGKALTYHEQIPIISLLEQIVLRSRALGGEQVRVPVFVMSSGGNIHDVGVNFISKDSAVVSMGNSKINLKLNSRGEILEGSTADGLRILRKNSVPDAALATEPKDYSAPPGAPYTAENVQVKTNAGHTLAGTLTIPKNAKGPVPVVVTITGSSPQDRDHNTPFGGKYNIYRHLADTLGKQGVAVLRMDDRGIGKSTGDFASATTADRAQDIREGIKFVRQRRELDSNKIFLIGLSEGGIIAPMIAAENDSLAGIIVMAGPASTGKEVMKYQIRERLSTVDSLSSIERDELVQERVTEMEQQANNDAWLKFFLTYDPLETAKKVKKVPVLILQGTTDKNVPPQDAEKLKQVFEQAGNKDVSLKMFKDLNHIFVEDSNGNPGNYKNLESFDVAPRVFATIVDWIKKRS